MSTKVGKGVEMRTGSPRSRKQNIVPLDSPRSGKRPDDFERVALLGVWLLVQIAFEATMSERPQIDPGPALSEAAFRIFEAVLKLWSACTTTAADIMFVGRLRQRGGTLAPGAPRTDLSTEVTAVPYSSFSEAL